MTKAFATLYFVLYVALVVFLLTNLFIAMVFHAYQDSFDMAEKVWRLRWTNFVLRCPLITCHEFTIVSSSE